MLPIAHQVGIHEVHYAMVAILAMGVGLFAPPFGVGYYVACASGRCNPEDGIRHIWRYLAALMVAIVASPTNIARAVVDFRCVAAHNVAATEG